MNHRPFDLESAIFKMFMSGVQTPVVSRVSLPPETTVKLITNIRRTSEYSLVLLIFVISFVIARDPADPNLIRDP